MDVVIILFTAIIAYVIDGLGTRLEHYRMPITTYATLYVRIYRYSMEGPTGRLPGLKPRGIDLRYRRLCTVRNRPWIRKYRTKSEEPLVP